MRVVVVGGGIGGLATAVALQRRGLEAEVFEAAPELRAVGAGIWVPTNAMQALDRIGLAGAVAEAGLALERIELHDRHAGLLDAIDLGPVRERYGHTTISIHRARLLRVLAGGLAPGTLHLGRRCVGVDAGGDAAVVRFEDGGEVRAGVVVGADGIHSVVREHVAPGARLRYSGQTCYRGIGRIALPPDEARTCRETWAPRCRFGYSAIGQAETYWFAPVTAPPAAEDPREATVAELAQLYAGFAAPIPAILDATPEEAVFRTDLYDLRPLPRWHRGRVVLVGDAAHATTPNLGQGGAQAIEDAVALARCIADRPEPTAAFTAFEALRRRKVDWIVRTSRRFGRAAHLSSPVARTLRNVALRAIPAPVRRRRLEALYSLDV